MNCNTIKSVSAAVLLASAPLLTSVSFAKPGPAGKPSAAPHVQTANVTVNDSGFSPSTVSLKAGVPARVTFTRTSKGTCATSVVIPEYKVKKDLPLGKPVAITFTPNKAGTYSFACGMNMVKGSVVVR